MIISLPTSLVHPRRVATQITALIGLVGLAAFSSVQAAVPSLETNGVVANDTFSIEVVGYNTANPGANIYLIYPLVTPAFGTTQNYANDALGGQTLTVISNESTAGGITTDFISLSVPTNFVPAGTLDNAGNTLNAIQFAFGNYFIPAGYTGNPLDLSTAAAGPNATQAVVFKISGVTVSSSALATVTPSNGNTALSAFGQTTTAGTDISNNQVTGLSFTITYAAVPEPSTVGAMLLGAAGLIGFMVVRRRACA